MTRFISRLLTTFLVLATVAAQGADSNLPATITLKGTEFVLIPGGSFTHTVETAAPIQETSRQDPLYRQVVIELSPYYIARYEATAQDLADYLNATGTPEEERLAIRKLWARDQNSADLPTQGCTLKLNARNRFEPIHAEARPATFLSWTMANNFAAWKGFRLPTEAEWQKAARGTDNRIWPWGDRYPDDTIAHAGNGRPCNPVPVNSHPQGVSPYGLFQMAGNVSEAVADWYNAEFDAQLRDGMKDPALAAKGSPLPSGLTKRINKGGDWSPSPTFLAIGFRGRSTPEQALPGNGVRFALSASKLGSDNRVEQENTQGNSGGISTP